MRAKTIGFERGGDPYEKLGIGKHNYKKDLTHDRNNDYEKIKPLLSNFKKINKINIWSRDGEAAGEIFYADGQSDSYYYSYEYDPEIRVVNWNYSYKINDGIWVYMNNMVPYISPEPMVVYIFNKLYVDKR